MPGRFIALASHHCSRDSDIKCPKSNNLSRIYHLNSVNILRSTGFSPRLQCHTSTLKERKCSDGVFVPSFECKLVIPRPGHIMNNELKIGYYVTSCNKNRHVSTFH